MMIRRVLNILAVVLCLGMAGQAQAGWKLVEQAQAVKVAKGRLSVTPGEKWNRNTARPIKKGEVWTLDGPALNELYFVSGLIGGETLFKDVNKKVQPLPAMSGSMVLADIPEFYESSTRIALGTSLFEFGTVEPISFSGHDGIRFEFSYQVKNSPVTRKGVAAATLVNGQLYLISFIAPSIHYFDHDRAKADAIIASAKI